MSDESNLVTWAREEITRAGLFAEDSDYNGMLGTEVMKLIEILGGAGHSGASAARTVGIFERLARWEPLVPLTDNPSEWMHIAEDVAGQSDLWQSKRAPSCFSNDGGKTYYNIDEKLSLARRTYNRIRRRTTFTMHKAVHA